MPRPTGVLGKPYQQLQSLALKSVATFKAILGRVSEETLGRGEEERGGLTATKAVGDVRCPLRLFRIHIYCPVAA